MTTQTAPDDVAAITAQAARIAKYCAAIDDALPIPVTADEFDRLVKAVVALADEEQAHLHDLAVLAGRVVQQADRTNATVFEHGAAPHRDALHVVVGVDGWGGLLHVHPRLDVDLGRDITDGDRVPLVRWDIPLFRSLELADALDLLTQLGHLLDAGIEAPTFWDDEARALREAHEHLVRTGRVVRDDDTGQIRFPDTEGAEL
ncbi:hypothetical protein G7075_00100 [Phycicoccus sp. HDW14]|uniref:hypothetical protein n=1 Tax=Phycicoccus sp. HDW14 TaxID=2714941 RepID=UPI00140D0915|nr:hypothetical protein [Phycicoccus sp. HDW14]QIM19897.1 hypothetical protein G7075_00100 [Phycicoccus sp. HDW14]